MKKFLISLLLLISMTGSAWAASQGPLELVKQTSDNMLAKLKEERAVLEKEPGRIYELVNSIVLPHFDFETMAKRVLGKYWKQADDAQRKKFIEEFRTLLVRTYAKSLTEYTDQKITFLPLKENTGGESVTVRSEVSQAGGFPIEINYDVHQANGEWKVFDVIIDGVSLATNYRTSFTNEIRQGGIDKLIAKLAERNRKAVSDKSFQEEPIAVTPNSSKAKSAP